MSAATIQPATGAVSSAQSPMRGSWTALTARLRGLSIRSRLIAMVAVVAVLWLVSVLVSATGLLSAKNVATGGNMSFPAYEVERDARGSWLTQDDQSNMAAALFSLREPSQQKLLAQTLGEVEQGHTQTLKALHKLIAIAPTGAERATGRKTLVDLAAYNAYTVQMKSAIAAGEARRAVHLITVENAQASAAVQQDLNSLSATLAAGVRSAEASTGSSIDSTLLLLLIVVGVGLAIAGAAVTLVIRAIVGPLSRLQETARNFAQGDIDSEVSVSGSDEIGQVGEAFGEMALYLREMAAEIGRAHV